MKTFEDYIEGMEAAAVECMEAAEKLLPGSRILINSENWLSNRDIYHKIDSIFYDWEHRHLFYDDFQNWSLEKNNTFFTEAGFNQLDRANEEITLLQKYFPNTDFFEVKRKYKEAYKYLLDFKRFRYSLLRILSELHFSTEDVKFRLDFCFLNGRSITYREEQCFKEMDKFNQELINKTNLMLAELYE